MKAPAHTVDIPTKAPESVETLDKLEDWLMARSPRLLRESRQQRPEARLLKVTVPGECFRETFLLHHDKGNTVGE
jgi:hypothetical protein